MPPETIVADPPAPSKTDAAPPPAPTKPGDKFRAAMPKEKGGTKSDQVTPPPPVTPTPDKPKDETPPAQSPIDIALGEVKPTATPPAADDDISKTITELEGVKEPKSEHWERARGVMKKQSESNKGLSQELSTFKTLLKSVDPEAATKLSDAIKKNENLTEQVAKYREAVTALNVEYDPEYQEKYVAGRQKLVDRAISRVNEYGGNSDQFKEAFSLTGKAKSQALREALADVDEVDRPRIVSVLDQIDALDEEKADLRKDPAEAFEKLTARRREEAEKDAENFERARKTEFDKIVTAIPEKSPMFRQVDGHTDWNDEIKSAIATAEKALGKDVEFSEVVQIALKGGRYDAIERLLIEARKEIAEKDKQIAEFNGALPNLPGAHRKAPEGEDKRTPSQKFHDEMAKTRGGEGDV